MSSEHISVRRQFIRSTPENVESFRHRIYYAARDGMAIMLFALLADLPAEEISFYLNSVIEDDGQKCTPLLIAAKNGHEKVVETILRFVPKFKPDLEQEGTIQFDGYVIEGATALWSAAGDGHLGVVRTLVENGADVNHATHSNSTPLRAACFDGRLDIVHYLVEHNANLHIANKYNNTCLMIAAYKGHEDIVNYLLEKGANPDSTAQCGATALHFAAEHGHVSIVETLLNYNAKIMKNAIGMTPLTAAAERTKADVVDLLIKQPWCSLTDRIEALELLGASYANDKNNYNLRRAYHYMELAMKERLNSNPPLPKVVSDPIEAYDNHTECQTLAELENIQLNANSLHMESLVIRERILEPNNPELIHPIVFRGAIFADNAQFGRCVQLWLHALNLRHRNKVTIRKDLLRFAQVFSQMIHVGVELPFKRILEILEKAVHELGRNLEAIKNCTLENSTTNREELDDNVHTVLYLLVIATKLQGATETELHQLYQLVYAINHLSLRTKDGNTLLHLVVNAETPVDDFHTKNVCRFPCAATAKLLIRCGADVNACNRERNSPLHVIVAYKKPVSDFHTQHSIISSLIEAGAHIDCVNDKGETPYDTAMSTTDVTGIILRTQAKLSLKCIAAKVIKKFNLKYEDAVPKSLVSFIEMHGLPAAKC